MPMGRMTPRTLIKHRNRNLNSFREGNQNNNEEDDTSSFQIISNRKGRGLRPSTRSLNAELPKGLTTASNKNSFNQINHLADTASSDKLQNEVV